MADESEKAPADGEAAVEDQAVPGEKKSLVQKLLSTPVLIGLAILFGAGAGAGGMILVGGGGSSAPEVAAGAEDSPQTAEKKVEPESHNDRAEAKDNEGESSHGGEEETPPPLPEDSESSASTTDVVEGATIFKFEPFVVNVFERNTIHYLKLEMVATCSGEAVVEEMKEKMFLLRDKFLFLINDISMRELVSSGGKEIFKEDVRRSFNKFLKTGKIKSLYFTSFTIQ